jgi:hypothetical protein
MLFVQPKASRARPDFSSFPNVKFRRVFCTGREGCSSGGGAVVIAGVQLGRLSWIGPELAQ